MITLTPNPASDVLDVLRDGQYRGAIRPLGCGHFQAGSDATGWTVGCNTRAEAVRMAVILSALRRPALWCADGMVVWLT